MTTYDFVHLVIHAAGGKVEGRTKLQKVVYFVGVLTGDIKHLGYRPHYYGPYSPDVAGAVQELRGLRFLVQQTSTGGTTDESGFEKVRYDYALTSEGKQVAEAKAAKWGEEWERIREATNRLESTKVGDYVRLAIAAKTDILFREHGEAVPFESLKDKAAEHGWKAFTPEQYQEALQFLASVGRNPQTAGV